MIWLRLILSLFSLIICLSVSAQEKDDDVELEGIYDRIEEEEETKVQKRSKVETREAKENLTTLSDLGELAPFEDIAVIQRRYLPKTERFELSASLAVSTNNQFFNNLGLAAKGTYYFAEKYGVELTYLYLSSSERPITEGLKDNQRIRTSSLVEPESYMGAAFKWTPFYGKVAWFQEKIIPFDIYVAPGLGITSTARGDSTTFSIAAGQLFALSKASAVRWDLTWNFYQAKVLIEDQGEKTQNQNDLYLMIGYSFYFPEATYR